MVFGRMGRTQNIHTSKDFLIFTIFKKPENYGDFLRKLTFSGLLTQIYSLIKDTLAYQQVTDTIKNATKHGGDALLVARRCPTEVSHGTGTEFIIWDNGSGIQDIGKALTRGHTSTPGEFPSDYSGSGKGMDLRAMDDPIEYVADEIIVESGQTRAFRQHKSDSYHFETTQAPVPGTRVTLRFW